MSLAVSPDMIVGGLVALLFGAIAFFARSFFTDRDKRSDKTESTLEKERDERHKLERFIHAELKEFKGQASNNFSKLQEQLNNYERSTVVHLTDLKNKIETLSLLHNETAREVQKQEGKIEQHMQLLSSHISMLRSVHDKMDAVFRFIDAPKRPSDIVNKS